MSRQVLAATGEIADEYTSRLTAIAGLFDTPLGLEPSLGQFTSDAGSLPFRQSGQRIGPTLAFASALDDPSDPT